MGKAMFTIIGAMAELERNVIRERVVAGLDYARTHGTKSGRNLGRPRAVFDRDAVRAMRDGQGLSWREIAGKVGIGVGTVRRAYERRPVERAKNLTGERANEARICGS
jgi:putative DNA-invertase from lambdoid prophage Rac